MDLKSSVTCSRCRREMEEKILSDIPTCRVANYYCNYCLFGVSIFHISETRLEEMQEVHPLEDK
jgi:hypothetical protein